MRADGLRVGFALPLLRGTGSWRAPAVWPSVDVVFVIRDLVSPRTWLAFSHNLVGLVIGMGTFDPPKRTPWELTLAATGSRRCASMAITARC